jgi:hypothetical protein
MELHIDQFLRGVIAFGFALAGLYFLKFWKRTRERLFALFAVAFAVLSINRTMISLTSGEVSSYVYLIRLAAFMIILYAIWDANRRK